MLRILRRMSNPDATTLTPATRLALAQRLNTHGILPTPQRLEIAAMLLAEAQHLSADQVMEKMSRCGAVVSKATVYNTLGLLVERGLLRQVSVDSSKVFYDSNTRPHYHFYNMDDGTLTDVEAQPPRLADLPSPPAGTYACGMDIVIRIRHNNT